MLDVLLPPVVAGPVARRRPGSRWPARWPAPHRSSGAPWRLAWASTAHSHMPYPSVWKSHHGSEPSAPSSVNRVGSMADGGHLAPGGAVGDDRGDPVGAVGEDARRPVVERVRGRDVAPARHPLGDERPVPQPRVPAVRRERGGGRVGTAGVLEGRDDGVAAGGQFGTGRDAGRAWAGHGEVTSRWWVGLPGGRTRQGCARPPAGRGADRTRPGVQPASRASICLAASASASDAVIRPAAASAELGVDDVDHLVLLVADGRRQGDVLQRVEDGLAVGRVALLEVGRQHARVGDRRQLPAGVEADLGGLLRAGQERGEGGRLLDVLAGRRDPERVGEHRRGRRGVAGLDGDVPVEPCVGDGTEVPDPGVPHRELAAGEQVRVEVGCAGALRLGRHGGAALADSHCAASMPAGVSNATLLPSAARNWRRSARGPCRTRSS